jgi:hypothetical protein
MFTVMALFACSWALVEGYYRNPDDVVLATLTSDVASFLLVYVGGLLILEARSSINHETTTVPLQGIALLLLLVIVAPKDFSISLPGGTSFGLSTDRTKSVVSLAFDLAASLSIAIGAKGVSDKRLYTPLLLIIGCYVVMDLRHYYYEIIVDTPLQLTWFELVAYSVLKIAFTFTFGAIIAYHGMSEDDREKGWFYWMLHFFGLAGRKIVNAKSGDLSQSSHS